MPARRVLQYLERAESKEQNPDYADAIRIAWITTSLACQDHPLPFLEAFYRVYGIHPDNLMEKLKQRRLSQLERWYSTFWGELPPKKPSVSSGGVELVTRKREWESGPKRCIGVTDHQGRHIARPIKRTVGIKSDPLE